MKIQTSFGLECGHINKPPEMTYFWNDSNPDSNDIEQARYESFINFNKPGNRIYCDKCDDMMRIKRISIYVIEFDSVISV